MYILLINLLVIIICLILALYRRLEGLLLLLCIISEFTIFFENPILSLPFLIVATIIIIDDIKSIKKEPKKYLNYIKCIVTITICILYISNICWLIHYIFVKFFVLLRIFFTFIDLILTNIPKFKKLIMRIFFSVLVVLLFIFIRTNIITHRIRYEIINEDLKNIIDIKIKDGTLNTEFNNGIGIIKDSENLYNITNGMSQDYYFIIIKGTHHSTAVPTIDNIKYDKINKKLYCIENYNGRPVIAGQAFTSYSYLIKINKKYKIANTDNINWVIQYAWY